MKLFIFFLFISCGKIVESPYVEDVQVLKKNINFSIPNTYPVKISFISDVHNNYDDLRDFVFNNKSDLIIHGGDLSNVALASEFNLFLKYTKNKNIISAVGNHDLLNNGEDLFKDLFGLLNFRFEILDYNFIIINNNNWESSSKNYYKEDFVKNNLNKENNILVSHVSLFDNDRFNKDQINKNKNLLKNFILAFNGHDHNYGIKEIGESKKITIGSIDRRHYIELILQDKDNYTLRRIKF